MSPSSLLAAQTAADAPTFPAPIMLIFGRRITSFRFCEGGGLWGNARGVAIAPQLSYQTYMRARAVHVALLLLLLPICRSRAADLHIDFTEERLDNGLHVIYAPLHQSPVVHVRVQ